LKRLRIHNTFTLWFDKNRVLCHIFAVTILKVEALMSSLQAHLSELTAKHKALEMQIENELAHPSTDDLVISDLKRKKLRLKDEIMRLEAQIKGH
jgi:hypothetical protein